MKRFKVLKDNGFVYTLQDESGKEHYISLQVFDIEPPMRGEYIHLSEIFFDKLANEGVWHFSFGKFSEGYGKKITMENMKDNMNEILIIERSGTKYYLKRFYG